MRYERFLKGVSIIRIKSIRIGIVAVLFLVGYSVLNAGKQSLYLNLIDAKFTLGLIFLVVGMAFYIHNIGLFKTFRYWGYRLRANRAMKKTASFDARPMNLVAYTQHIMSLPKKNTALYLIWGLILIVLSLVMLWLRIYIAN